MTLKIIHKNNTSAGQAPAPSDLDIGEIAVNSADAKLYVEDNNGAIQSFTNDNDAIAAQPFTASGTGAQSRTVESKLKDIVSVKDFGAVGDGVTDDTAAINAAVASTAIYNPVTGVLPQIYFPPGKYLVTETINLRSRLIEGKNAIIRGDTTDIVVLLGGYASFGDNPTQILDGVERVPSSSEPVVRILGAKGQHITLNSCGYVQLYADTNPSVYNSDYSIAYSSFWFRNVTKIELTNNPTTSGSSVQWINENNFYLNRTNQVIIEGTYAHNNNRFFAGTFEGGSSITIDSGYYNTFEGIRAEGTIDLTFGDDAKSNTIVTTWHSSDYQLDPFNIVSDTGFSNSVHSLMDRERIETPLMGCSYETLRENNGKYNVAGISNITVNASNLTADNFDYIYDSGIISCDGNGTIVHAKAYGKTSGGIRVQIDGYDASKNPLSGSGYIGLPTGGRDFGQSSNAVNNSGSERCTITRDDVKYIRVRIRCGGAGLTCESLYCGIDYLNSKEQARNALSYSGTLTPGPNVALTPEITNLQSQITALNVLNKTETLADNVAETLFTFGLPQLTFFADYVTVGFELSYSVRADRETSLRQWSSLYGKVYGTITRGFESGSSAQPYFQINDTDKSLVTATSLGGSNPTITWAASVDAGADNAAKNAYLTVTVNNPFSTTNRTVIYAQMTYFANALKGNSPADVTIT